VLAQVPCLAPDPISVGLGKEQRIDGKRCRCSGYLPWEWWVWRQRDMETCTLLSCLIA